MTCNNHRRDSDSSVTTISTADTTCSEKTVFSKRFARRSWFGHSGSDTTVSWRGNDDDEPDTTVAAGMSARRRARLPVRCSRAVTDLTRGMRKIREQIGAACEFSKNGVNPDTGTRTGGPNQVVRDRYGPNERAGTFEMFGSVIGGVCQRNRPEAMVSMQFVVWRKPAVHSDHCAAEASFSSRTGSISLRRVPWLTIKREMTWAQATAIRVLEVWTDRSGGGYGFPLKIVFLPK